MRVVLDTNVIVSGVISSTGAPDAILQAWRRGSFQLITSAPLLEELAGVLARPHIRKRTGFSPSAEDELVNDLSDSAIVVAPTTLLHVLPDPDDDRLLEASLAGHADYIVTGDKAVLASESYEGIKIVSPTRFLAILKTNEDLT